MSAVERAEAALAAIETWEPVVNAFTAVHADDARARAAELDPAAQGAAGPLAGVPVAVKDTLWMAGRRCTRGSRAFADFVPDEDAVAVRRLRAAGAVIVGQTTNPELCFRGVTESALFGVTRNPHDPSRAAGGSSGGSGAAVAYGAVPIALGTDGGGSIRIPAAFCGVVGHKPTFGLVPVTPGFRGWETLSVVGPIAATVAHARAALRVLAGPDPSDAAGLPGGAALVDAPVAPVEDLRIAASADLGHLPVDPGVRAAFETAVGEMSAAGWRIERAHPDPVQAEPLWNAIAVPEGYAADRGLLERPDLLEADTARLIEAGADASGTDYLDAQWARAAYTAGYQALLAEYDVLLTPTMQVTALPTGVLAPAEIDGQPVDQFFDDWCSLCLPANLTGMPATSVPCGYDDAGLPVGLLVTGPRGGDALTLAVAEAWEARFRPRLRRPAAPT